MGGEAAFRFDADRPEVGEDQLAGAGDRKRGVVRPSVAAAGCLAPDAVDICDELVELVAGLVSVAGPDQPHVDGAMPPVGNDRQQDVVTLLHASSPVLDRFNALGQYLLVVTECVAGFGGDQLPSAGPDPRQIETSVQSRV